MTRELRPQSNISDLVDYLLEMGIDIHIFMPDNLCQMLQIRADWGDARCAKSIDMTMYKNAPPELRNMIVTRTVNELVDELIRF